MAQAAYDAIFIDPVHETHEAFGSWLPRPLAAALRDEVGSEQIIFQTELLARVAAKI